MFSASLPTEEHGGGLDFMRSMALASAPVCFLLLVLKLANCSLLVLLVAENWLHGLRFVWVRATHILCR